MISVSVVLGLGFDSSGVCCDFGGMWGLADFASSGAWVDLVRVGVSICDSMAGSFEVIVVWCDSVVVWIGIRCGLGSFEIW